MLKKDDFFVILLRIALICSSQLIVSYIIPWESHVNLRLSCSEFYADFKKIGCHFFQVTLSSFFDPSRS